MVGKNKYNLNELVAFVCNNHVYEGIIRIIDYYGTMEQKQEVSYDIEVASHNIEIENTLYKHIPESDILANFEKYSEDFHKFNELLTKIINARKTNVELYMVKSGDSIKDIEMEARTEKRAVRYKPYELYLNTRMCGAFGPVIEKFLNTI